MKVSAESSPLSRFFAREGTIYRRLLKIVRSDLKEVVDACHGARQTNRIRGLMDSIKRGAFGSLAKPARYQLLTWSV